MTTKVTLGRIAAILLIVLAVQTTANAQFGVLKKIQQASSQSDNSDKKANNSKDSYWDQLTDEQRWAVQQLKNPTDGPTCPWPMTKDPSWDDPKNSGMPYEYGEFLENIDNESMESIQELGAAMNARYFYAKRVIEGMKGVSFSKLGDDYLSFAYDDMQHELDRYETFQRAGGRTNLQAFFMFNLEEDPRGGYRPTDDSQAIIPYGGCIAKKNGKWMFTFSASGANTTYATPEEVENCRKFIDHLIKCETLLSNPFAEQQSVGYLKAHYMQDVINEAIANNSKDNIVYAAYPEGSSLNTPEMKAKAMQIFKSQYGKVYDVIITGDWMYKKNVFDQVVDRSVDVAVIVEHPVAKAIVRARVGNDKIGDGWGELRWYGISGHSGYVK